MSMLATLNAALDEHPVTPADQTVVLLALAYAQQIDAEPARLAELGPKLLAALESLLMSPRARASATKGAPADAPTSRSKLDELRARRAARLGDAAS